MIENKDEILAAYDEILADLDTTEALERQKQKAKDEAVALVEKAIVERDGSER